MFIDLLMLGIFAKSYALSVGDVHFTMSLSLPDEVHQYNYTTLGCLMNEILYNMRSVQINE